MFTLNCKGKLVTLDKPLVMGIINVTPDSFYEGSRQQNPEAILTQAAKMLNEGADILDIGGQSTRPGSERISAEKELSTVLPAIELIFKNFPGTVISVDTYYSRVAEECVKAGASIINDISAGLLDPAMIGTVAGLRVPYICMHMKGTPGNMQDDPSYDKVTSEVLDFLIKKTDECTQAGIIDIIIDPGFGFGKTISQNFKLLKELTAFQMLGKPILAGLSRKSTVYKTLGGTADDALNGTTVLNVLALVNGANILRVHDVKEAREAIKLFGNYDQA